MRPNEIYTTHRDITGVPTNHLFLGLLFLGACTFDEPVDQSGDPISPELFMYRMNLCVENSEMETRHETIKECARWVWACTDHYSRYRTALRKAGFTYDETYVALESCREVNHAAKQYFEELNPSSKRQ